MMVSVEATGKLERRMKVQVPADRIEEEVDKRLRQVGKTAKLKGFRPGKVPLKVIRQQYGGRVRRDVLSEMMQSSYSEALERENLQPASGPRIETDQIAEGKDLEYTAIFEVYPEIELKNIDGIKLERPSSEITEADIDDMVENLREQRAEWTEVERQAGEGDRVLIDYEGTVEGEPFAGGTGEQIPVVLGEGRMLKDLEDGLAGVKVGEERDIAVTFPEDYKVENLSGKTAQFKVVVRAVEEQVLPEIDDAFLQAFGVSEGGVETLRAEVSENMQREMDQRIRAETRKQLLEQLVETNPVDVPASLVEQEIQHLREDAQRRLQMNELPPVEPFEEQARSRVTRGLLINELIQSQDLTLDQDRVQSRLTELASTYEDPQAIIDAYRANPQLMSSLQIAVMEEQAVEWLEERAAVTERKVSFKELMNPK